MARTGATFNTALQGVTPRPTTLLAIVTGLSAPDDVIRVTSDDRDRVWPATGGATYTSRPFETDGFLVSTDDRRALTVRFADVDGYFATWLNSTDFRHKKITRFVIDRSEDDDVEQAQVDAFRIVSRHRGDRQIEFSCEPWTAILTRARLPARILTRAEFPGLPNEPYGR